MQERIKITHGFSEPFRIAAAEIYFEAFEQKIGWILGGREKAKVYIAKVIDPNFALCATKEENGKEKLVGIVGFKTAHGSMFNGSFTSLVANFGFISALWRTLTLLLLEREIEPNVLLMDGIAVASKYRGNGIGSKLLFEIITFARTNGYQWLRLDVVDTNQRVKALYERMGFKAIGTENLGPLKHLFGFSSSTQMVLKL